MKTETGDGMTTTVRLYGWHITREHADITDSGKDEPMSVMGPGEPPLHPAIQTAFETGTTPDGCARYRFRMYDDDGILYYSGTLMTKYADREPSEAALLAPLMQYGMPNAGAVEIRYDGHPEWTCEA